MNVNWKQLMNKVRNADAGSDLILYLEDSHYSFNVIATEIKMKTKLGKKMLKRLKEIGLVENEQI